MSIRGMEVAYNSPHVPRDVIFVRVSATIVCAVLNLPSIRETRSYLQNIAHTTSADLTAGTLNHTWLCTKILRRYYKKRFSYVSESCVH